MAFYDFYNYKSMVFFYNGVYRTHNSWNDIIFFYFNTTWKTKKIGKKVHFINCFWRVKIKRKMGIFKKNKGKTFKNRENSTNTGKIKKQKEKSMIIKHKSHEKLIQTKRKTWKNNKNKLFSHCKNKSCNEHTAFVLNIFKALQLKMMLMVMNKTTNANNDIVLVHGSLLVKLPYLPSQWIFHFFIVKK